MVKNWAADTEPPTPSYARGHHRVMPELPLWRNHFVSILDCAAFQRVTAYSSSPTPPCGKQLVARRLATRRRWLTL